ncbi:lactonase family protein [Albibacterium sp.]|uniref:lactonase family protein n=1 Tax=Albibacterium sp. TaxID=2952885 RepID=UPI002B619303|nr:lactonase family protein [Albibacterium sp.]HUH19826.1 lactonase family protein [Albibacterium sp.]
MNFLKTSLLICCLCIFCKSKAQDKFDLLIGTYTNGTSTSEGIYVYTFDSETGTLEYKNEVKGIDNPSYIAISPDHKNIYAISESGGESQVYAYKYDSSTGKLTFTNKESAGGQGPCYVSVDKTGSYVFTANYGSGSLAAVPLMKDGSLGSSVQEIYNKGNIIDGKEGASRMHSVVMSPDNNYLFAPNLGIDKIGVYHFDSKASSKPLTPAEPEFVNLAPGSGPRHFVFHPNGKYAYVIQELDGGITSFDYHAGKLSPKQTVSILPPDFKGKFGAADIHISPDGKFLYGSNRIDINEIVIYNIDENTGNLTFVGRQSSMGRIPRNFVIDPTGNFLLVANQDTNNIIVFSRNQKTGLLTPTDISLKIDRPVCLKFVY